MEKLKLTGPSFNFRNRHACAMRIICITTKLPGLKLRTPISFGLKVTCSIRIHVLSIKLVKPALEPYTPLEELH
jgi:hypothetical protein